MTTETETPSQARGVLESATDQLIVLRVPGTSYQVHLVPAVPVQSLGTPVGKRIKGVIEGNALRIFAAAGGGRFIEPISGEPRIVAGMVREVDAGGCRLLIDAGVPMWLTLDERQPVNSFQPGQLVNCYVQSGMRFTPV